MNLQVKQVSTSLSQLFSPTDLGADDFKSDPRPLPVYRSLPFFENGKFLEITVSHFTPPTFSIEAKSFFFLFELMEKKEQLRNPLTKFVDKISDEKCWKRVKTVFTELAQLRQENVVVNKAAEFFGPASRIVLPISNPGWCDLFENLAFVFKTRHDEFASMCSGLEKVETEKRPFCLRRLKPIYTK